MRKHRRFLGFAIAFLLSIAVISSSLALVNLTAIIKKIQPSIILILTFDQKEKPLAQGSGFFVSKNGDAITNYHVLQEAARAVAKTAKGRTYPVTRILADDQEADLVRISVDIPRGAVRPLPVSNSLPEIGERIIVIGSPLGLEQTVSDGIVSAVRNLPQFGNIIQITAPISPGSSGSPVVNMRGEVIGVVTFLMPEGQNLNFAIPGEKIATLTPGKGKNLPEWRKSKAKKRHAQAESLYSEGLQFVWAKDYEKALQYFKEAVEKNPEYAAAYFYIGYCNSNLGRYHEAIEAYKQAIRLKPDDADAHYNLGIAYVKLGRYSEASDVFKEAIRLKPDYVHAHNNLGIAYGNLGRHHEAIEAYKQAIRLKPDYAMAHSNLGAAYGNLGRHHEAIEAYKQAIRLKPDCAKAHNNLGICYLNVGDKGSALDEYEILKDLDRYSANKLFNLIYR